MLNRLRFIALLCACVVAMTTAAQTLTFRHILDRADRPQPTQKVAYGVHADQYGELWLPRASNQALPVVVLIHGGCWRADLPGPELVAYLADALSARGVAVWSITYRRVGTKAAETKALDTKAVGNHVSPFAPYPDTFLDVATAMDKLRELAPLHKLDLARVVTTGHSAGGHLAMWLAARHRLPADSPLFTDKPLRAKATIGIAAIADLALGKAMSAHACGADTVDKLVDVANRKDPYRDTSVTPLLPLGVHTTLVSGVYDAIVAPAQALRFAERAKEKNEAVTLITLDNAGHFELIAPWTPAGAKVVDIIVSAARRD
jgi:acetyl esterase/lipase